MTGLIARGLSDAEIAGRLFLTEGAVEQQLAVKWESMTAVLDERQRRRWLGVEARALGRGGVSMVARVTGVSRTTW